MAVRDTFIARSRMPASAAAVFSFHAAKRALPRLTPPFDPATVLSTDGGIRDGDRTVLRVPLIGPLSLRYTAEHRDYRPGESFVDVQAAGPFASWEHLHRMEPDGRDACFLTDRIEYAMPFGPLGYLGRPFVRRKLERSFAWRHALLHHDMALHARSTRPLKVAISGASGMLGRNLTNLLGGGGHQVVPIVRGDDEEGIRWSPRDGTIDRAALEGFDAIVHLAGEPVAQRWDDDAKARILKSRRDGTRLLAEAIAGLDAPPKVFVSMSAVGYYGHREGLVDEGAQSGAGFLAEVCRAWEGASHVEHVRVVNARMGVVLTPEGGALKKMLPVFQMGLGGRLGPGTQGMSWVSIDDAVGALYWAILEDSIEGPMNVAGPEPVDNATFTSTLARVLRRPAPFVVPSPVLELALGQLAEEALLSGVRALPKRLQSAGYPFAHGTLDAALRHVLGKNRLGQEVPTEDVKPARRPVQVEA